MWPSSLDLPDSGLLGSSGPSAPESRLWLSGALVSLGASAKSLHLELIWEQNVNSKTLNDERQNATFFTEHFTFYWVWTLSSRAATYLSPRFCFKWLTGLNCREKTSNKDDRKVIPENGTKCEHAVIWWRTGMWRTFWGLTAATGGVPGGVWVPTSGLNVWFAICMHSSRVFRKVVHVDFTMFPVSIPA